MAKRLSATTGRHVGYVDVGPDAFRQALTDAGLPGWLVDGLVASHTLFAAGHAATVTDEVAKVTGQPPRTFEQFAADHRLAFSGQPS